MNKIRIISDIHGHYKQYAAIVKDANLRGFCSIQIGDFGFSYGYPKHAMIDPKRHKFFGGNHDNYDKYYLSPYALGDYGLKQFPDCKPFFFVRGARSIDRIIRTEGKNWWHKEELDRQTCQRAMVRYDEVRPKLVITHDCPEEVSKLMLRKCSPPHPMAYKKFSSRTGQLLQRMLDSNKPEKWIFGHWHCNISFDFKGVRFTCLDSLSFIDI